MSVTFKSHLPPEGIKNKCLKISLHSQHISCHQSKDHKCKSTPNKACRNTTWSLFPLPICSSPCSAQQHGTNEPAWCTHRGEANTTPQTHRHKEKRGKAWRSMHKPRTSVQASLVWYLDSVRWREMQIKTMPSYLQWNKNNVLGWAGLWLTL